MKKISSQIKTRVNNVAIVNQSIETVVLRGLLWSLAGLVLLYVLFLANTVFNIVERRSLEREALTLSDQVGNLELNYTDMSNKIDLAFSQSLGFEETQATFAVRKSLGSLGFNTASGPTSNINTAKDEI